VDLRKGAPGLSALVGKPEEDTLLFVQQPPAEPFEVSGRGQNGDPGGRAPLASQPLCLAGGSFGPAKADGPRTGLSAGGWRR